MEVILCDMNVWTYSQAEFNEKEGQSIDVEVSPEGVALEITNIDINEPDSVKASYEAHALKFKCQNKEQLIRLITILLKAYKHIDKAATHVST